MTDTEATLAAIIRCATTSADAAVIDSYRNGTNPTGAAITATAVEAAIRGVYRHGLITIAADVEQRLNAGYPLGNPLKENP